MKSCLPALLPCLVGHKVVSSRINAGAGQLAEAPSPASRRRYPARGACKLCLL